MSAPYNDVADGDEKQGERGAASRPASASTSSYLLTLGGSAGMIVLTLFTGVVSARLLSPDGRGVVGAIAGWVSVLAILGSLGFREGMQWLEAKSSARSASVLTVSVVGVLVLGAFGIVVGELLIPWGFAAQSAETVRYARIFMIWILPFGACYAFTGQFGARHRFMALNAMRIGQPLLYALALALLWIIGRADVVTVLSVQVVAFVIPAIWALVALARQSGFGSFDKRLGMDGARYGLRAFGSTLGQLANARLDLMILPALVVSSEIGLYVVAVSAGTMIVGLFGSLQVVVFPSAARTGGAEAVQVTQRAMRIVFAGSIVLATFLAIFGGILIRFLYSDAFDGAVTPLRLLLPGVCCLAVGQIVEGGLKGIGSPGEASIAQFCGVVVTILGLVFLLPAYGIIGAAITSSAAYCTVLAVALTLFARATKTRIRDTVDPVALVTDVKWAARRVQAMVRRS